MRAFALILVFTAGYWAGSAQPSWADTSNNSLKFEGASKFSYDNDPNNGVDQWRLVPHLGWRKFAPVDAFYFDWLNYRKTTRNRYFTW